MERLISPATGGMLWSHLAKCSLLLSIQAKLDCRYLTLVGTLRAMAGHTGRAWGILAIDELRPCQSVIGPSGARRKYSPIQR
jgi:hypothetical protein